jgi:hypothetical protein
MGSIPAQSGSPTVSCSSHAESGVRVGLTAPRPIVDDSPANPDRPAASIDALEATNPKADCND